MPSTATTANEPKIGRVSFRILSEGAEIAPTIEVLAMQVSNVANRISTATIHLRDGDVATQEFELSDSPTFAPGAEITIQIGNDSLDETVFVGKVVKQKIQIRPEGGTYLKVECKHAAFAMTLNRQNRYFEDVTDGDALTEILNAHGQLGEVSGADIQHRELVQYYATDWDYLLSRSEANGLLVLPAEGKLAVKAPEVKTEADLKIQFGENLLSFEAELDARYQWEEVIAKSWAPANQELVEVSSTTTDFIENGDLDGAGLAAAVGIGAYELRHSGIIPEEELQSWADATLLKSRLAKIRGRARFIGTLPLKPGMTVELTGVGDRFNGNVYLTGVNYELTTGNCFVDVQFGLAPKGYTETFNVHAPAAAGLAPCIQGLQVGLVTQLAEDPDGEDRILVRLPILDGQQNGTWARLATLDAGEDRGWVVRPEIDDEVIVGFINNDPRCAVVLGHLHSSQKPAPIAASDDNHEKGFKSRSGMEFIFNDDDISVLIKTPAGNQLLLNEADQLIELKDQNDNKVLMDPNGIEIYSPGDINISSDGKINISAAQDLSGEGMNIDLKASLNLKAEGGAQAELKGGTQAAVKAAMVMIN